MFLRWKTYRKQTWRGGGTHIASLVQSVRIEGAVRQQYIAYVGSIGCSQGQFSSWAVSRFWQQAEESFNTLTLSEEQRVRLRATITQRIGPRPSEETLQEDERK